jgi:hypothetical protein
MLPRTHFLRSPSDRELFFTAGGSSSFKFFCLFGDNPRLQISIRPSQTGPGGAGLSAY